MKTKQKRKKPQPKPSPLKSEDGLTLVCADYDAEIHHLKDLTRRIMNEIAGRGFADLFKDQDIRRKIIDIYEKRKERLMVEDKLTLLFMEAPSIDVLIPEGVTVKFVFDDETKTRQTGIA